MKQIILTVLLFLCSLSLFSQIHKIGATQIFGYEAALEDISNMKDSIVVFRDSIDNLNILVSDLRADLSSLLDTDDQTISITGNDISIEDGNTIRLPKDTVFLDYSGRHYLVPNWETFNNAQGYNNQNFNQNVGTGNFPLLGQQSNGIRVPFDSKLTTIEYNGRVNNGEDFDFEISFQCLRSVDGSNVVTVVWEKKFTITTTNARPRLLVFDIDKSVLRGEEIMISTRRVTGTTTRYFQMGGTLYFEKN